MKDKDLEIPANLHPAAAGFCKDLIRLLRGGGCGGCKAFHTPEDAAAFCTPHSSAVLVVCHDGGSLAPYFNLDYGNYKAYDKVDNLLKARGLWREAQNAAVTLIYLS